MKGEGYSPRPVGTVGHMLRIAAATYLVLMQFAGPLLCCCAAVRPSASCCRDLGRLGNTTSATGHACCDHHGLNSERQGARHGAPDCPRLPSRSGCPCQQDSCQAPASPLDSSEAFRCSNQRLPFQGFLDVLSVLPTGGLLHLDGNLLADRDVRAHPFLTSTDLLCVFHNLRC